MGIFDWFSKNNKTKAKPAQQSGLAVPRPQQEPKMWQCSCGRKNFDYVSSCACGASKRNVTAPTGNAEKNRKNTPDNQVIYENRAISARPPYVVLKLDGAFYIQLFDLMCSRFFDITCSPEGNYSIALFRLRDEEVAWVQNNTAKLDQLANQLYERIPGDRFVKASMVTPSGQTIPLSIRPGCDSIDPPTASTQLYLNLSADILSDAQKEKYIYSPLKAGVALTREQVKDLSLGERLSVAFAIENTAIHELPAQAEKAKKDNYGFMMSMAAEWLKNNPFYILLDKNGEPAKIAASGITFTCVFSTEQLAEKARNGNPFFQCAMVQSDKIAFWKQLSGKGIGHIVADNTPLTLTVAGCLIYAMAEITDNSVAEV